MALATTNFDKKCAEFWDKLTWSTGALSFAQFFKALAQSGVNLSFSAVKKQWDIIDVDGSDDMDLSEFTALMKSHFEASDDKVVLQNAFNSIYTKLFSKDNTDLLSHKTETPRIQNKNVRVVLSKRTMKQNKKFETAIDEKLSDVFKAIDVDSSGTLEFEEMWQAVQILSIPINYQDLKLTFGFFDTDKNGHIEEEEFKRWMKSQITKYWSDNPEDNPFVALQRSVMSPGALSLLSQGKTATAFTFAQDEKVEKSAPTTNIFEKCTISDVHSWDIEKVADFIHYLFKDQKYDQYRDRYVAIFMTNMIDGKQFMELERKQISHLGIMTRKGERHVSLIRNAQRHIKQRSNATTK